MVCKVMLTSSPKMSELELEQLGTAFAKKQEMSAKAAKMMT